MEENESWEGVASVNVSDGAGGWSWINIRGPETTGGVFNGRLGGSKEGEGIPVEHPQKTGGAVKAFANMGRGPWMSLKPSP